MRPLAPSGPLVLTVLVVASTVLGAAPNALGAQSAGTPDAGEAARITLRSDLRNLVTAQEAHFAENGRYATTDAALMARFKPSAGVTYTLVEASTNSYGIVAKSAALGDGSCTVSIGLGASAGVATARERRVYPEGMVACDGDVTPEREVWGRHLAQVMPAILLRLVKYEERHYGRHGAYTGTLAEIEGWRSADGAVIRVETATVRDRSVGFRATATHPKAPGLDCVVFVGFGTWRANVRTARDGVRANLEMTPACDDFAK